MKYGVGVGSWAPCFAKRVDPGSASERPHRVMSRCSSAAKSWSLLEMSKRFEEVIRLCMAAFATLFPFGLCCGHQCSRPAFKSHGKGVVRG